MVSKRFSPTWGLLNFNKGATPSSSSCSSSPRLLFSATSARAPRLWAAWTQTSSRALDASSTNFNIASSGPEPHIASSGRCGGQRNQKIFPQRLADRMSEFLLDRMLGRMSDCMPEYLSENIPCMPWEGHFRTSRLPWPLPSLMSAPSTVAYR